MGIRVNPTIDDEPYSSKVPSDLKTEKKLEVSHVEPSCGVDLAIPYIPTFREILDPKQLLSLFKEYDVITDLTNQ